MINIRKSSDRCHIDHGWLQSAHTFSFGHYHDLENTGYRSLIVINEDRIQSKNGFEKHGHRDTEIVSYVINGQLHHQDTMGSDTVSGAGDVQVLSAGAGMLHSESNDSDSETHFLQFWLVPSEAGLRPRYTRKNFSKEEKLNKLCLILSPDARDGSLPINSNAFVYASLIEKNSQVVYGPSPFSHNWIQLVTGELEINEMVLEAGDGCSMEDESRLTLTAKKLSEVLLFNLA